MENGAPIKDITGRKSMLVPFYIINITNYDKLLFKVTKDTSMKGCVMNGFSNFMKRR